MFEQNYWTPIKVWNCNFFIAMKIYVQIMIQLYNISEVIGGKFESFQEGNFWKFPKFRGFFRQGRKTVSSLTN